MDRIPQRDKPPERTSKSTAKAGPRPWEVSPYIHQEEPENAKRSSHGDPRLENLSLHQHLDSDFIPHDDDHEALHPGVGFGATLDLHASVSTTSDLGTLAGCRDDRKWVTMIYDRRNKHDLNIIEETCHGKHKVEEHWA
jgi:hypothetical protein